MATNGNDKPLSPAFNDINADAQPDLMSAAEYAAAYRVMARDYLDIRISQQNPSLLYVTGLPGAGKSTFVEAAKAKKPELQDAVHINFDDLRVYHPRYAEHVKKDPVNAAARIDKAVEGLIGWLGEEAAKRKLNVILDDAAMGQEMTRMILSPFRDNGYDVSAVVVAVPSIVARQSVHLRFEENFAAAKQGQDVIPRWVNKDEQDHAPAALVETVETLEEDNLARRLVVVDRQNNLLYTTNLHPHQITAPEAVKQEMRRELTAEETTVYQNKAMMISLLMQAREGGMSPNDNLDNSRHDGTAAPQQKSSRQRKKF
jgi:predicted kinase